MDKPAAILIVDKMEQGSDNPGEVPLEAREQFFEKYAPSSKISGNGLGSYSIRLMAEVQGGIVSMDTGHGRTRLTVTLPLTAFLQSAAKILRFATWQPHFACTRARLGT